MLWCGCCCTVSSAAGTAAATKLTCVMASAAQPLHVLKIVCSAATAAAADPRRCMLLQGVHLKLTPTPLLQGSPAATWCSRRMPPWRLRAQSSKKAHPAAGGQGPKQGQSWWPTRWLAASLRWCRQWLHHHLHHHLVHRSCPSPSPPSSPSPPGAVALCGMMSAVALSDNAPEDLPCDTTQQADMASGRCSCAVCVVH